MKECFETHNFQPAVLSIIRQADDILSEYYADGMEVTVRQLYYRFIALDLFPESWIDPVFNAKKGLPPDAKNTIKNYMRLGQIITKGRMAGLLDWAHLVDRDRDVHGSPSEVKDKLEGNEEAPKDVMETFFEEEEAE